MSQAREKHVRSEKWSTKEESASEGSVQVAKLLTVHTGLTSHLHERLASLNRDDEAVLYKEARDEAIRVDRETEFALFGD